jgi:hypothetical protein
VFVCYVEFVKIALTWLSDESQIARKDSVTTKLLLKSNGEVTKLL